jgi:hypothetical protein
MYALMDRRIEGERRRERNKFFFSEKSNKAMEVAR